MSARELFDRTIRCCSRQESPTSIINHGDSWAPNFMTRSVENGNNEIMILDYQAARVASPVLDISFFIYTSTDEKCREKHFTKLLEYYHAEFAKVVDILGSDINKIYPWKVFMKDVRLNFCMC